MLRYWYLCALISLLTFATLDIALLHSSTCFHNLVSVHSAVASLQEFVCFYCRSYLSVSLLCSLLALCAVFASPNYTLAGHLLGLYLCLSLFFLMLIYFWKKEREREREWEKTERELGRGRERQRHRIWSRLQALSCQHRAWHGRTHELQDHDLSWSRSLNLLSHPGTPVVHFIVATGCGLMTWS